MTEKTRDVASLVSQIVNELVDEPDQVEIRLIQDSDALLVEISVGPDDVGKIIGRHGRVIKSIRTLARATAALDGSERVDVEIVN